MAETNCKESPTVRKGETFSTYLCNVTVDQVYDTNNGKITVTPSVGTNKTPQTFNVTEGNHYDYTTDAEDFRVYVTTIFLGSTGTKIMQFTVCELTSDEPLHVTSLTLSEPVPGVVAANVVIEGAGSGTLQISWGTEETTTHAVSAGGFGYERAMPAGTHEICAYTASPQMG